MISASASTKRLSSCLGRQLTSRRLPSRPVRRTLASSAPKKSGSSTVWQVATFGVVGVTFLGVAHYLNTSKIFLPSDDADGDGKTGPVAPQAAITSHAYFDVAIDRKPVGRIVLGLHGHVVPTTVAHFERNCRQGYAGTLFHRIIPGFMCQGGAIQPAPKPFEDENFVLRHTGPGVLSMANAGRNTNTTQFFITTARTPHLDGRHVVFGVVTDGWDVVKAMEDCGSSSGRPGGRVEITGAGVLEATD